MKNVARVTTVGAGEAATSGTTSGRPQAGETAPAKITLHLASNTLVRQGPPHQPPPSWPPPTLSTRLPRTLREPLPMPTMPRQTQSLHSSLHRPQSQQPPWLMVCIPIRMGRRPMPTSQCSMPRPASLRCNSSSSSSCTMLLLLLLPLHLLASS